jgi:hypothetical protein
MPYVVAFNRDRDFYQVPLALFERHLLSFLITDLYYPNDRRTFGMLPGSARLRHRCAVGLPSAKVKWNISALALQLWNQLVGNSSPHAFDGIDRALSLAALKCAQRTRSNLFLYSHYAYDAFTSNRSRDMVKGLFMFHPHTDLIQKILAEDFEDHPECLWSLQHEKDTAEQNHRAAELREEWRYADFVACASSFTERSLHYAGCHPANITVVPYGIDIGEVPFERRAVDRRRCRFLFVGQGVQRKGLHHLLKAWSLAKLPNTDLTLILSRADPGIVKLAGDNVTILAKQTRPNLLQHYNASDVFVLPSLVEGFGLVYLEALAAGCYCIGTENTGLPDLASGSPPGSPAIDIAEVGKIESLAGALERAHDLHQRGNLNPAAIRQFAETKTWETFRAGISDLAERNLGS